jgi:Peptide methionine sulfoxide reductase
MSAPNRCATPRVGRRHAKHASVLKEKGFNAITTEILPAPLFYFAEGYHQQHLAKNPHGYCGLGGTGVSCPIGTGAVPSSEIDGVALEVSKLDDLERGLMRRRENDPWRAPRHEGFTPPRGAKAPAVSGLEAGKAVLRARCREIVAPRLGEGEELFSHLDADGMQAQIFGAGMTTARAIKASERALRASRKRFTEDVSLRTRSSSNAFLHGAHSASVAKRGEALLRLPVGQRDGLRP